jgi:hypothetical protein
MDHPTGQARLADRASSASTATAGTAPSVSNQSIYPSPWPDDPRHLGELKGSANGPGNLRPAPRCSEDREP